jgi:hypothetical protein
VGMLEKLSCEYHEKSTEQLVAGKWLKVNEHISYKNIIFWPNVTKIKTTGSY